MRLNTLELWGFRNYVQCECSFSPDVNIIYGANAQGKTNLLEAIYLLSCGRSFRTRSDSELIQFGGDSAAVKALADAQGREQTVEIYLKRGARKTILKNGARVRGNELSEAVSTVFFCAEDLNLVRGGAAVRRRLLDYAISQLRPGYAVALAEFNRLYEHKTRILRDWREKPSLLDTLQEFSGQMCRASAVLIRYRAAFSAKLTALASAIHREFTNGKEELGIVYKTVSTVTDPLAELAEITAEILEHQRSHFQAELNSGQCLTGAHKDDLYITINGVAAREFASQGQARTVALSLKLAEREMHLLESGENPVLLLDDVLSELDGERQDFVLNRIGGGQTFITCCEDRRIAERTGGAVFVVENGTVKREAD